MEMEKKISIVVVVFCLVVATIVIADIMLGNETLQERARRFCGDGELTGGAYTFSPTWTCIKDGTAREMVCTKTQCGWKGATKNE